MFRAWCAMTCAMIKAVRVLGMERSDIKGTVVLVDRPLPHFACAQCGLHSNSIVPGIPEPTREGDRWRSTARWRTPASLVGIASLRRPRNGHFGPALAAGRLMPWT